MGRVGFSVSMNRITEIVRTLQDAGFDVQTDPMKQEITQSKETIKELYRQLYKAAEDVRQPHIDALTKCSPDSDPGMVLQVHLNQIMNNFAQNQAEKDIIWAGLQHIDLVNRWLTAGETK